MSYYNDLADDLIEAMNTEPDSNPEYKVLDHGFVKYVTHMGDDRSIVNAARLSYKSSGDAVADKKLLMRLYHDMHTSPFEMGKITFHIRLPIFVMRQYVRHRMQNLNETSARYKALPSDFYIPKEWRVQDKKNKQHTVAAPEPIKLKTRQVTDVDSSTFWTGDVSAVVYDHCSKAHALYDEMLAAGVGRELARMVLPLNTYTEVVSCMDMKNMLGFFRQRLDPHAQLEIQAYAIAMFKIADQFFPWTMDAYRRFKFVVMDQDDPALQYGR